MRNPMGRIEEIGNSLRMAMHHRFLTGAVSNPWHMNAVVFELDGVVTGIDLSRTFAGRLSRRLSRHTSAPFDIGRRIP